VTGTAAVTAAVKKRLTRIVVTGGGANKCTATIDDMELIGKRNKRVAWMVEDATTADCPDGRKWHVELDFHSDWNNGSDRIIEIARDDVEKRKIHSSVPETGATGLDYDVYIVYTWFGGSFRDKVIDPELEIEQ
jgi:hypothetical protein